MSNPEHLVQGVLGLFDNPYSLAIDESWQEVVRARARRRSLEAQLDTAREAEEAALARWRERMEAARRLRDNGEPSEALVPDCDAAKKRALAKERRWVVRLFPWPFYLANLPQPAGWEIHRQNFDNTFVYVTLRKRRDDDRLTDERVTQRVHDAVDSVQDRPLTEPRRLAADAFSFGWQKAWRQPKSEPQLPFDLGLLDATEHDCRMPAGP